MRNKKLVFLIFSSVIFAVFSVFSFYTNIVDAQSVMTGFGYASDDKGGTLGYGRCEVNVDGTLDDCAFGFGIDSSCGLGGDDSPAPQFTCPANQALTSWSYSIGGGGGGFGGTGCNGSTDGFPTDEALYYQTETINPVNNTRSGAKSDNGNYGPSTPTRQYSLGDFKAINYLDSQNSGPHWVMTGVQLSLRDDGDVGSVGGTCTSIPAISPPTISGSSTCNGTNPEVNLSWDNRQASRYLVFQDGVQIDNTSANTSGVTSPASGPHSYYVQAWYDGGAMNSRGSRQSNTVNITTATCSLTASLDASPLSFNFTSNGTKTGSGLVRNIGTTGSSLRTSIVKLYSPPSPGDDWLTFTDPIKSNEFIKGQTSGLNAESDAFTIQVNSPTTPGIYNAAITVNAAPAGSTVSVTPASRVINVSYTVVASTTGTITASPNPCNIVSPATSCSTSISWSTANAGAAQVWVRQNGGPESNFGSGLSGTQPAPWITGSPNYFDFYLYDYTSGSRGAQLATVHVTATTQAAPPPAGLSISPSSQTVNGGSSASYTATYDPDGSGPLPSQNVTTLATWSSGNTSVATSNGSGSFTGATGPGGTTNVFAQYNSLSASATINVNASGVQFSIIPPLLATCVGASPALTARWQAGTGATSHNIYRSVNGGGWVFLVSVPMPGLSYRDTGLTTGSNYSYWVQEVIPGNLINASAMTATAPSCVPGFTISPLSLSFSATQNGALPATQMITVSNPQRLTLNFNLTDNATWLSASPSVLNMPALLSGSGIVSVNTTSLSPGTYSGSVTFTDTNGATPQSIPVTYVVNPPASLLVNLSSNPSIGSAPLNVSFTADVIYGGSASDTINYSFWWDCSYAGTSVATAQSTCGALPAPSAGACASNTVGYKCNGVLNDPLFISYIYSSAGTYTAKMIVERGGSPSTEARNTLTVSSGAAPTINFSASPNPVTSGNSSTLSWTTSGATSCTGSNGTAGWAGAKALSGDQSTGAITSNTTFTLTCTGPGGTTSVDVGVGVVSAGDFTVTITPGFINLTAGNSTTRTVTVASVDGWSGFVTLAPSPGGGTWVACPAFVSCSVSPTIVSVPAWGSITSTYTVSVNSSAPSWGNVIGLDGTSGTIVHQGLANLVITPAPSISLSPSSFNFSGIAGGSNPASQTLIVSNSGGATLNWTGSDDQTWLSLGTLGGAVAADGSQNVSININSGGLSAGTYNGTITITDPAAPNSPRTVPVTLSLGAPPSFSMSLIASPVLGPPPLTVDFSVDVTYSGNPFDTINYSFWWNCNNSSTDVGTVTAACGVLPSPSAGTCAANAVGYKCNGVLADPQAISNTYISAGTYTIKVIAERGSALPIEARDTITVNPSLATCDWTWRQPPGLGSTPSQPVGVNIPSGNISQFANSIGMVIRGNDNKVYRQNCIVSGGNCTWNGSWVEINPGAGQLTDSALYTAVSGSGWEVYLRNGNGSTNRFRNINSTSGWSGWSSFNPGQSYGTPTVAQDVLGRTWEFRRESSGAPSYRCAILQGPYSELNAPTSGSVVSGAVDLIGFALDSSARVENSVTTVRVYVDGVLSGNAIYGVLHPTACTTYPGRAGCNNVGFYYIWDSTSVVNGPHVIRVEAIDNDPITPHSSTSQIVAVTTDNPTLGVSAPSCPSTISINQIASCTANAYALQPGGSVCAWSWSFQNGSPSSVSVLGGSFTNTATTTFTATGSKLVVATATDCSAPPKFASSSATVNVSFALPKWREVLPR